MSDIRPLVAKPLTRPQKIQAWFHRVVTNGAAVLALALAVTVLSVSCLVLQSSLASVRHQRDVSQGQTDCRGRITFQYNAVVSDLQEATSKGLIALQQGNQAGEVQSIGEANGIIPVLDAIKPIYKAAIKTCQDNPNFQLLVPAYSEPAK